MLQSSWEVCPDCPLSRVLDRPQRVGCIWHSLGCNFPTECSTIMHTYSVSVVPNYGSQSSHVSLGTSFPFARPLICMRVDSLSGKQLNHPHIKYPNNHSSSNLPAPHQQLTTNTQLSHIHVIPIQYPLVTCLISMQYLSNTHVIFR